MAVGRRHNLCLKSVHLGHGQGEKSHRIVHSIPKQKCKAEIFAPLIPPTLPLSLPRSLRWCLPGCLRAIGGSPPRRPFLPLRPSATPRRPPVGPPTWKPIIRRTMRSPPRRRRLHPDERADARTDEALMGMEDERSLAPSVDLPARPLPQIPAKKSRIFLMVQLDQIEPRKIKVRFHARVAFGRVQILAA